MRLKSFRRYALFFMLFQAMMFGQNGILDLKTHTTSSKYLEATDGANISELAGGTAITVELWIYPTTISRYTYYSLISKTDGSNNGWDINLSRFGSSTRYVYAEIWTNGTTHTYASVSGIQMNKWNHIAMTYDGSTLKLYHSLDDGNTTASTKSISGTINSHTTNLFIGKGAYSTGYRGDIDEVRIWNVVKSQSQIETDRQYTIDPSSSNLVAYYRYDVITAENAWTLGTDGLQNYSTSSVLSATDRAKLHFQPASGHTGNMLTYSDAFPVYTPSMTVYATGGTQYNINDTYEFEQTDQDSTSSQQFYLKNNSETALDVTSITIQNDANSDFSLASPVNNITVNSGDSTFFTVRYTPTDATGVDSADFRISSNDVQNSGIFDVNIEGSTSSIFGGSLGSTITNTMYNRMTGSAADVDGDGDVDIFVSGSETGDANAGPSQSNTESTLYLNDGSGRLSVSSQSFVGTRSNHSVFLDVDNDGDQDLLLCGYYESGDAIFLYKNNGSGVFTYSLVGQSLSGYSSSQGTIVTGDFDHDGDLDFITGGWPGTVGYFENTDFNGTFVQRTDRIDTNSDGVGDADFTGTSWPAIVAGDFDKDGDLDIFVSGTLNDNGSASDVSGIYVNNGKGIFTFTQAGFTSATDRLGSGSAVTADFNNDGNLDIIFVGADGTYERTGGKYSSYTGYFRYYTGNGNLTFTNNTGSGITASSNSYWGQKLSIGDIDNDGDIDLFFAGDIQSLYLNNGSGVFTLSTSISFESNNERSSPGFLTDVTGDRKLDVVALNRQKVNIYQNTVNKSNTTPLAPTLVTAAERLNIVGTDTTSLDSVDVTWNAASDDETGATHLSYNIHVKNITRGTTEIHGPFDESATDPNKQLHEVYGKVSSPLALSRYIFYAEEQYSVQVVSAD